MNMHAVNDGILFSAKAQTGMLIESYVLSVSIDLTVHSVFGRVQ
jgi:hypothetical protein